MKFLEEIKKFQNNGSFYTVSENDKTYRQLQKKDTNH